MITEEQKTKIIAFAKGRPIEVIYLFGSQARNEVKPLSDYDFAILFSDTLTSSERFDLKLESIGFLTGLFKTDTVDVLDLNSAPSTFRYSAIAPRMDIYTKDERERVHFEFKTIQEFFDLLYFIKRHTKIGLATITQYGI